MDNGCIVATGWDKTHVRYFYSMTKFMVDSAAIVMLYYPRFHDEEGLSKANVIKVT